MWHNNETARQIVFAASLFFASTHLGALRAYTAVNWRERRSSWKFLDK